MGKRLYYLDYLRVILTMLVIVHHTAIAYGAGGDWIYKVVDDEDLTLSMIVLTLFTAVNQSFFMGFFFFISGYFTPSSYDRKGASSFLRERFFRLGIPLLFYILLLGPIISYLAHFKDAMTLSAYYMKEVFTFHTIHFGPLWFVETLIYFTIFYVIIRKLSKQNTLIKIKPPTSLSLFLTAIFLGVTAFLVRLVYPVGESFLGLQFGYFPSYILLFIVGIIAKRLNWLELINKKVVKIWQLISLITIPVLPVALIASGALDGSLQFEGGINVQSFVYALWEPFVAIGLILGLLSYFREHVNKPSPIKNKLAKAAYTVYIIHPAIIVGLSFLFHGTFYPMIEFIIVSCLSIILCFFISSFIIKIPGMKRIL
jgi:glucans biosynthesis protein C